MSSYSPIVEQIKAYKATFRKGKIPNKFSRNLMVKLMPFVQGFRCFFIEYWGKTYGFPLSQMTIDDDAIVLFGKKTIACDVLSLVNRCIQYACDDDLMLLNMLIDSMDRVFFDAFKEYVKTYQKQENRGFGGVSDAPKFLCDVDILKEVSLGVSSYVYTARVEVIKDIIVGPQKCCVIAGNSASGKTVSVIQSIDLISRNETKTIWFDAINVNVNIYNIIYTLLSNDDREKIVIVIDNAHARPADVIDWLGIIHAYLEERNTDYCVLLLTWYNALDILSQHAVSLFGIAPQVHCSGREQIESILNKQHCQQYRERILCDSREDVLVAKSILDYIDANGQYPTPLRLSKSIYEKATKGAALDEDAEKCLYYIAALGEFEIHVQRSYLLTISEKGLNVLEDNNIVRLYQDGEDNMVYLGHRSMSNRVANYIRAERHGSTWLVAPEDIAVAYLKKGGQAQIHGMLERLDSELHTSRDLFANLWKAFVKVRMFLYKAVSNDVAWGQNMASMIFAAEALSEIAQFDSSSKSFWEKQASAIRARWIPNTALNGIQYIGNDECEADGDVYHMTSEIVDFTKNIRKTMSIEERSISYADDSLAENLDFIRFHDNWLLGLLLGFEGSALDSTEKQKKKYVECAKNMQLPCGAFYPSRVSWVTSRVLMGLASCGYNYNNSTIVRDACHWLIDQYRSSINSGDTIFPVGGWISGTGTWNSDIQITLMTIRALNSVHYPIENNYSIQKTVRYVLANAKDLAKSLPNPLDIVWIIAVLQSENEDLTRMGELIDMLSKKTIELWGQANQTSYEKEQESSDISFMARELLNIMWNLVKNNIKKLLHGLEQQDVDVASTSRQIFISYRRVEGGGSMFANTIFDFFDNIYRNEVFYDVKSLKHVCSEFNEEIERAVSDAVVVIVVATDHVFDRCLKDDYNIEKDVFINEIKHAFKNNKSIIVVYNQTVELPSVLKQNNACYEIAEKLSQMNAVFYNPSSENGIQDMLSSILDKLKEKIIK